MSLFLGSTTSRRMFIGVGYCNYALQSGENGATTPENLNEFLVRYIVNYDQQLRTILSG